MAPKHTTKMQSRVPKHRKAAMCLTEKTHIIRFFSAWVIKVELMANSTMNQLYTLNKISLHSSTYKIKLYINWLTKILWSEFQKKLMKVKEESEKVGLKLNIQKTKIMASGPITSWQIDGKTVETVSDFPFLGSKITADGDCSHEIKRHSLGGNLWPT